MIKAKELMNYSLFVNCYLAVPDEGTKLLKEILLQGLIINISSDSLTALFEIDLKPWRTKQNNSDIGIF